MNKSYKTVWNETSGTYVAASEVTKSRGKSGRNTKALVAALLAAGVGFGTAVKSEAAATPNSFAAGILGTNSSNSDCISSADGAQVVTNGDCSAATQQAGIVSYNSSGTAGAFFTVTDPNTAHIGAGGTDQMRITNSGVFVLNTLDMGGQKITNLAKGTVSASSTDAVTGAQLYGVQSVIAYSDTGAATINASGGYYSGQLAIGNGASAALVFNSVAVGTRATVTGSDSVALGSTASASGGAATAVGAGASSGMASVAFGSGAKVSDGGYGVAMGFNASATKPSAMALGANAMASGDGSVAIGRLSTAPGNNAVAIGYKSTATADNTVSVGNSTQQRQIVNMAAGQQATDAVNYGQLQAAGLTVDASGKATNAFVAYDGTDKATATLGGASGTTLTNLEAGALSASSTDAVNGSQLYTTNQNVTANSAAIAQNTGDISTNAGNIAQNTTDIRTLNTQVGTINGQMADVVKYDTSEHGKITLSGASGTTLSNLAAGTISASSTDAVNGSQLYATNQSVATNVAAIAQNTSDISANVVNIAQNTSDIAQNTSNIGTLNTQLSAISGEMTDFVKYDASAHDKVTLAGVSGTTLTNVAAGGVSASSMDAVNGSQLYATNQSVAQNTSDIATNAGNIAQNTSDIAQNTSDIAKGAADIAQNTSDIAKNAGDITNIDSRVTNVEGSVSTITNQINNGELGLVQQDQSSRNLTVGAATDGVQISMAGTAGNRVVTGVAAGALSASSVDAVNGSQLYSTNQSVAQNTSDIATNAGNIAQNTSDIAQNTSDIATNAGDIAHNTSDIAKNAGDIATNASDITNIDSRVTNVEGSVSTITNQINNGELGLVQQDQSSRNLTVGAATDGVQISMAGTAGNRVVTGVAAGAVNASSVDAVNGSQLYTTNQNVAQNTSDIATNAGNIAQNTSDIAKNAGDITNIDSRVTNVEGSVSTITNQINNGELGLVQQDQSSRNLTVGAATDGVQISMAGTAGNRVVTGVAAGAVNASSVDAVNGSQLYTTNQSVAQNTSDIATNAGNIAQNTSDIAQNTGDIAKNASDIATNAGDIAKNTSDIAQNTSDIAQNTSNIAKNATNITNLDTRVTNVEGSVTDLTNQINSGVVGLVQQDQTTGAVTVASNTGGLSVDFAGTAGARELLGVAAGTTNTSAVNLGQLSPVVSSLGGGAQVNADGSVTGPTYHVQGGTQTTVGGALDTLDTGLTSLQTQISNGSIGIVTQDATSRDLLVGGATDGVRVNMAGTAGNRVVTGVAAGAVGAASVDAVNGSQLYANAASTAAALGGGASVNADGTVSAPSYSVGGTTVNNVGAAITNIDGRVTQNASDIASLQSTVGTMSGSVANAVSYDSPAHNQVTLGGSTGAPAVKLTNLQDGELSATSTDAVTGAQLWNTNQQLSDLTQSVQNQQQTGSSSMSINTGGQPAAAATGNNAIAMGGGAQASGDNSVAIGSGSVADQANTVSVGSQGNERRITNVANGTAPTDAVNVGQMQSAIGQTARAAYSGVAAATALTMIPEVDPGKTLAIGVAGGSYKGYQAAAVGASARITQNLKVKIGAGISGSETTVGAGASYQW